MASFGLGYDVAAPPEISPDDADILNDIFFPRHCLWGGCYVNVYLWGTTRTGKSILGRQFCTPKIEISQKRFKSFTESELKELEEERQSEATKKSTKWAVKLFQGMLEDFKLGLKKYMFYWI